MRAIFDQRNARRLAARGDSGDVCSPAIQVCDDDRLDTLRKRPFYFRQGDEMSRQIDIQVYRQPADREKRGGRVHAGIGNRRDAITGADTSRAQRDFQRVGGRRGIEEETGSGLRDQPGRKAKNEEDRRARKNIQKGLYMEFVKENRRRRSTTR
ncbi:MAG: hypothetical protein Q8O34_03075 [Rhodocyclaceae bacterium]|nr:hypothetical protein [Rhodocyclaceae bacterium]